MTFFAIKFLVLNMIDSKSKILFGVSLIVANIVATLAIVLLNQSQNDPWRSRGPWLDLGFTRFHIPTLKVRKRKIFTHAWMMESGKWKLDVIHDAFPISDRCACRNYSFSLVHFGISNHGMGGKKAVGKSRPWSPEPSRTPASNILSHHATRLRKVKRISRSMVNIWLKGG